MKIVIDARNINTTTGRYAERLVHFLEELDKTNQYTVLVLQKDIDFYKPRNPNFSVVGVPYTWYSLNEQVGMARYLASLKADLVHFTMPHHPILYFRPYITTFHDLILLNTYNSDKNLIIFKLKQFIGRFAFYAMAHRAAHIITPTNYVKKVLMDFSHVKSQKITVTYEGCEVPAASEREYTPLKNKQFLLYVGQQSDYKNIRRLMQAHQTLRKDNPNLLLALAGRLSGKNGTPLQTNKAWAEKQGFDGIMFTDFLPNDQLRWVMKRCAAYVFPSLMEGFGLPALEAMSSGAPVVSSNATCLPEVYGDAAHYFDPKNVDDMVRAIKEVLGDTDLRQNLISKGWAQAAKYSWRRMAKQTLQIYQQVLTQASSE